MSISPAACVCYAGTLEDIPSNAPPGILYLKSYLSTQDSLTSVDEDTRKLVSPNAVFINNSAPPVHVSSKNPKPAPVDKRAKRKAALQALNRELRRVWDIDNGNGRRSVIYESRNYFVFAQDAQHPVCMPEAGVIELEAVTEGQEGGVGGWWAVELRSWHDRIELRQKRTELGC